MDIVYMVCQEGYEEEAYIIDQVYSNEQAALQRAEQMNRKYNSGKYVNEHNIYQVLPLTVYPTLRIN